MSGRGLNPMQLVLFYLYYLLLIFSSVFCLVDFDNGILSEIWESYKEMNSLIDQCHTSLSEALEKISQ